MEEASGGRVPEEVEAVAEREGIEPAKLARLVARAGWSYPGTFAARTGAYGSRRAAHHKGQCERGHIADTWTTPKDEIEKAMAAVDAGADTVMDLSTGGDLDSVRRKDSGCSQSACGHCSHLSGRCKEGADIAGHVQCTRKACQGRRRLCDSARGREQEFSGAACRQDPRVMGVVSRGGSSR